MNEAAEVLTAHGFRLLARADEARPAFRLGLVAAALFAFTAAGHGHPDTDTTRSGVFSREQWFATGPARAGR